MKMKMKMKIFFFFKPKRIPVSLILPLDVGRPARHSLSLLAGGKTLGSRSRSHTQAHSDLIFWWSRPSLQILKKKKKKKKKEKERSLEDLEMISLEWNDLMASVGEGSRSFTVVGLGDIQKSKAKSKRKKLSQSLKGPGEKRKEDKNRRLQEDGGGGMGRRKERKKEERRRRRKKGRKKKKERFFSKNKQETRKRRQKIDYSGTWNFYKRMIIWEIFTKERERKKKEKRKKRKKKEIVAGLPVEIADHAYQGWSQLGVGWVRNWKPKMRPLHSPSHHEHHTTVLLRQYPTRWWWFYRD